MRENLVAAARLRGGAVDPAAIEASLAAFDLLPLASRAARSLTWSSDSSPEITVTELLKNADIALYTAKRDGRSP